MKKRTAKTTTVSPLKVVPNLYGHYNNVRDFSTSVGLTLQKNNISVNAGSGVYPGSKYGNIGAEYTIPIKDNNLKLYGSISKESLNPFNSSVGAQYTMNIGNRGLKKNNKKKL